MLRIRVPQLGTAGSPGGTPIGLLLALTTTTSVGGSTITAALTESVSAADSASAVSIAAAAVAESVTAADAASAVVIAVASVSEAVSAADSSTGTTGNITPAALTESVSATDAESAVLIAAAAVAESVTAADAASAVVIAVASVSEAVSAADSSTATTGNITTAALTESVSAADAESAVLIAAADRAEAVTAADSVAATLTAAASVSEAVTAADAASAVVIAVAAVSEAVSAADSATAFTGNLILASVTEAVSAGDSASCVAIFAGSVAESVTAADQARYPQVFVVNVAEALALADLVTATATAAYYDPIYAALVAIRTTLAGDATITALLFSSSSIYDVAPEGAPTPFITIGTGSSYEDWSTDTTKGEEVRVEVRAWDTMPSNGATTNTVRLIARRVRELLHFANLNFPAPHNDVVMQVVAGLPLEVDRETRAVASTTVVRVLIDSTET